MKLILPTLPHFLRDHFPKVRQYLGGNKYIVTEIKINHSQAKARRVTLFSGTQRSFSSKLASLTTSLRVRVERRAASPSFLKSFARTFLTLIIVTSVVISVALLTPSIYYGIFPADVIEVQAPEKGTAFGGEFDAPIVEQPEEEKYQPPFDETLPKGDWLIIPRIGVRSEMQPTENPEEALAKGLWWVPDFGKPGDSDLPIIVAGHRYGWKWWWKDDYWKYHSFYLLPETEPGDRIEIISGQRKWVYEIYAGEQGEEITDYNADLILYTCKYLTGPVRHFRYGRLIDPTTNTQAG